MMQGVTKKPMTNVPFRVLLSEGLELSLVLVDATRHLVATNTTK